MPDTDLRNLSPTRARWALLLAALLLIAAAIVIWRLTPLAEVVTPERLADWFRGIRPTPGSALLVIALFVLGGFLVLPLGLLIAATALVFPAPAAFAISMIGSLANALALYLFGSRFLRGPFRQAFGPTVAKLSQALDRQGILAVAVVRSLPIAPFTFVNVAAGSLAIRLSDSVIGTALGLLPGLTIITAFGSQLRALWENPTPGRIAAFAGIIAIWIGVAVLLQRVAGRRRKAN